MARAKYTADNDAGAAPSRHAFKSSCNFGDRSCAELWEYHSRHAGQRSCKCFDSNRVSHLVNRVSTQQSLPLIGGLPGRRLDRYSSTLTGFSSRFHQPYLAVVEIFDQALVLLCTHVPSPHHLRAIDVSPVIYPLSSKTQCSGS